MRARARGPPPPVRAGASTHLSVHRWRRTSGRLQLPSAAGTPQRVHCAASCRSVAARPGRRLLWLDRPPPSPGHAATARDVLPARVLVVLQIVQTSELITALRATIAKYRQPDRAPPPFAASRRHSPRVLLIRRHGRDPTAPAPGRSADGRPCRRRPRDRRRQRADPRPRFADRLHWCSGRDPTTSDPDRSRSGRDLTTSDPGRAGSGCNRFQGGHGLNRRRRSRARRRWTDSWEPRSARRRLDTSRPSSPLSFPELAPNNTSASACCAASVA